MVKWFHYRPGVAQRVGTGIALLFHNRGTRRGWVVSSMPRLHFTPRKDLVPILQEAGWAPGAVWTGGKSRPHRNSILDRPTCSQSLYRLSYPTHTSYMYIYIYIYIPTWIHSSQLFASQWGMADSLISIYIYIYIYKCFKVLGIKVDVGNDQQITIEFESFPVLWKLQTLHR